MSNPASVLDAMIADPSINGQHVDVDKEFGGQCWDLAELFAERCGVPKATTPRPWAIPLGRNGWASEAWTAYDQSPHMQQFFDKVPAGQQQKGDIVVYNGHGIYTAGHIALSLGGNAVFEENADPDGSAAHVFNNRAGTYLLGALRLKGGEPMGKWDNGKTYNLLFHACSAAIAKRAQDANYVGYFGAADGKDAAEAFDGIISSPQFDFLVDEARKAGQVPTNVKPYDGPELFVKS